MSPMQPRAATPGTEAYVIKNRWSGEVQFTAHIRVGISTTWLKIGAAVKWAISNGANLRDADLGGANLRGADLGDANLRGANLRGADLGDANLRGANLRDANLGGANLGDADLGGANLRGANLRDADLGGADLGDADLRGANLRDADLGGADLGGADLGGANLGGADLRGADLGEIKSDFLSEVLRLPNELDALRTTLLAGKIDGSSYSGECACLAGTLAQARGTKNYRGEDIELGAITFHANSFSLRERWFLNIKVGHTPENSPVAAITLKWIDEAIAIRDAIRASVPPGWTLAPSQVPA